MGLNFHRIFSSFHPRTASHSCFIFSRCFWTASLLGLESLFHPVLVFETRVVPDVKAQEVEALRQVNNVGFFWRERQSSFAQPVGEEVNHCLRIFLGLTEHTEVVCVPDHCSFAVQFASFSMFYPKSFFHAMQRDISE